MTDRSIESELKDVQKKLNDIEKKQEMMKKLYDLEREQEQKMGKRPLNHVREMT
jgi:tetrahydromethanopterin S-methyltransferase subunit G